MIAIYVKSTGNPAILRTAKAKWAICATDETGAVISKRGGAVIAPNSTVKKASLIALRDALKRFTKAAVIVIYISDPFVRNMLQSNMPQRWSGHDWRLFRYNRDIKYCEIWQEINELLKAHAVKYATAADVAQNKILKDMEVK